MGKPGAKAKNRGGNYIEMGGRLAWLNKPGCKIPNSVSDIHLKVNYLLI